MVRVFLEEGASGRRHRTRGSVDRRSVHPHELPALRLPIVDRADPEDRRREAGEARRVRQRGAPLARTRLRREAFVPFLFRVPCLREGRVHFVAARRAVEFRLVVQACGSAESFLQAAGADHRRSLKYLLCLEIDVRTPRSPKGLAVCRNVQGGRGRSRTPYVTFVDRHAPRRGRRTCRPRASEVRTSTTTRYPA